MPSNDQPEWARSDFGESVFGAGAPVIAAAEEVHGGSFLDALSPEPGGTPTATMTPELFADEDPQNEHLDIPAFMRRGGL